MSEPRGVVVSGIGVVSAAGESLEALAEAVRSGRPLSAEIAAFEPAEGEPTRAAEIAEFDLARHVPGVKGYIDRTSALALAAGKMALEDAGLSGGARRDDARSRDAARELGLAYGTQWGCLDSMELFFGKVRSGNPRFAPPLPFSHSYANSPASIMAIELGLGGDHRVYSTGRLSGAWAVAGGAEAVSLGAADRLLTAASDSFTRSAFRHYHSNNRLLPDEVPDAARDEPGRFLLGEGAACLVLEAEGPARQRGARPRAALLGVGVAARGDRASALDVAAREALARGGLGPGDVKQFIGTSPTGAGAQTETAAAARLTGTGEVGSTTLSPLRGESFLSVGLVLGETMGASGALAAAVACACAEEGPALVLAADGPTEAAPGLATGIAILFGPALPRPT